MFAINMSLKDINIKQSYESGFDDLINDFYVPLLCEARYYDRIAGFFTSSSFAISSKGIYSLIENNGKMRLLISPKLNEKDIEAIINADKLMEDVLYESITKELLLEEDLVIKKHHQLLTWLLKNNYLEIRIVLVRSQERYLDFAEIEKRGIFHQKIGIVRDNEGNIVSFSGSINETLSAWNENIEEFKTFKSWEPSQLVYCESDINKFEDYWNGRRNNLYVSKLPKLIEQKLIEIAPDDVSDIMRYFRRKNKKDDVKSISLFSYQRDAFNKWVSNDRKLLFEMATGTGKTRTAIACIEDVVKKGFAKIVIVSTPQTTLSQQWKTEIESLLCPFEAVIFADGDNSWRSELSQIILELRIGIVSNCIVYTTHDTSSTDDFINTISDAIDKRIDTIFIGDEVHALGSKNQRKALLEKYKYRVGLSATPSRWFDEDGTKLLEEYFNNSKYEFTIKDALITMNPLTKKPFLSKFYYFPESTSLDEVETEKYEELSSKIKKYYHYKKEGEDNTYLERLLQDRADIIKNAKRKIIKLEEIIVRLGPSNIENTIIFVSPLQIDLVSSLLNKYNILHQYFTQKQGKKPEKRFGGLSERQYILDLFKKKVVKVLLAIRCLDEGIDIPTADTAILLSSTTNPREYIQRVGRVIRQSPNKTSAAIYDLIVVPKIHSDFDQKIQDREFARIESIARNSVNNAEVLVKIYQYYRGD